MDVQQTWGVYASFIRDYEKSSEQYNDEWEARRAQLLAEGLPDDGTVDGKIAVVMGGFEPSPFPYKAADV